MARVPGIGSPNLARGDIAPERPSQRDEPRRRNRGRSAGVSLGTGLVPAMYQRCQLDDLRLLIRRDQRPG